MDNMKYKFAEDITAIRKILEVSQEEFADRIGIRRATISENENGEINPSDELLEKVYGYAYSRGARLNRIKEMLYRDDLRKDEILLFHGAKSDIIGDIDLKHGRRNNDFGPGFYMGESYEQALSFVSTFERSSVYFGIFNPNGLKKKVYGVNLEWMLTIALYRGTLDEYTDNKIVMNLKKTAESADYIIAPIADNRMFQIIHSFIYGEITDMQCMHCLSAANLGMQYVFTSQKAIHNLKLVEKCYVPMNERKYYAKIRLQDMKLGDDKVKVARLKYRGQGKYIDEVLK